MQALISAKCINCWWPWCTNQCWYNESLLETWESSHFSEDSSHTRHELQVSDPLNITRGRLAMKNAVEDVSWDWAWLLSCCLLHLTPNKDWIREPQMLTIVNWLRKWPEVNLNYAHGCLPLYMCPITSFSRRRNEFSCTWPGEEAKKRTRSLWVICVLGIRCVTFPKTDQSEMASTRVSRFKSLSKEC